MDFGHYLLRLGAGNRLQTKVLGRFLLDSRFCKREPFQANSRQKQEISLRRQLSMKKCSYCGRENTNEGCIAMNAARSSRVRLWIQILTTNFTTK
jgi:hypothetical protein